RTHHLCQRLLTDFWDYSLRHALLAKMSEHKKHTGQSLFAGIEQLVDQVLFITDIAGQQIRHEHIGKSMFPMKRGHHRLLLESAEAGSPSLQPRIPYGEPGLPASLPQKNSLHSIFRSWLPCQFWT